MRNKMFWALHVVTVGVLAFASFVVKVQSDRIDTMDRYLADQEIRVHNAEVAITWHDEALAEAATLIRKLSDNQLALNSDIMSIDHGVRMALGSHKTAIEKLFEFHRPLQSLDHIPEGPR